VRAPKTTGSRPVAVTHPKSAACFDASRLLNGHTQQINKNVPHAVSCASTKLQHTERDTLRNTPLSTLIKLHTANSFARRCRQWADFYVFVRVIHGQSHAAAFFNLLRVSHAAFAFLTRKRFARAPERFIQKSCKFSVWGGATFDPWPKSSAQLRKIWGFCRKKKTVIHLL
jgi:hypothetical protein